MMSDIFLKYRNKYIVPTGLCLPGVDCATDIWSLTGRRHIDKVD